MDGLLCLDHVIQSQQQQQQQSSKKRKSPTTTTTTSTPSTTINNNNNHKHARMEEMIMAVEEQQQQQQQHKRHLLEILMNTYDVINNQELKESVTAQYLWACSIPRDLSLKSTVVEEQAKRALWMSVQSVSLQHLPSSDTSPYYDNDDEFQLCLNLQERMFRFHKSCFKGSGFALCEFAKRYPRLQMVQLADELFREAKNIVVNPLIYKYIAVSEDLVQAILYMVSYLSVIGERMDEAKLLLGAVNTYLNRMKPLMKSNDVDHNSESGRMKILLGQLQSIIRNVEIGIYFNTLHPQLFTMKGLKKYLKMAMRCYSLKRAPMDVKKILSIKRQGLESLFNIVKQGAGVTKIYNLENFLQLCRDMRYDVSFVRSEKAFATFWSLFIFTFQIYAVQVALNEISDVDTKMQVLQLQYSLAHEITQYCYENIALIALAGARYSSVLMYSSSIHIQQSIDACRRHDDDDDTDTSTERSEMMEILSYLHSDMIVFNCMLLKHKVNIWKSMNDALKTRIQIHQQTMASDHQPQSLSLSLSQQQQQQQPLGDQLLTNELLEDLNVQTFEELDLSILLDQYQMEQQQQQPINET